MTPVVTLRVRQLLSMRVGLFGLLSVSMLSVASSGIGFVLQVVLARHFGASVAIDGYLFAISVPTFLAGLGAAALSYTAIPALVLVEHDVHQRSRLLRYLQYRLGMVAVGFVVIGLPAMVLQQSLLPLEAELRALKALPILIALGWAIGGTQLFASLYVVEMNSARRPITAALLALPPNAIAIAVVLLSPDSIVAAPAGVLLGSLGALGCGAALTRRSFGTDASATAVGALRQSIPLSRIGWSLLAMSSFSAYAVVDAFWAPRAGAGTLANLGYAQRMIIGIGGLVLAGPSAVLTPRFAARLRDSGSQAFMLEVTRAVAVVAVLAVVMAGLLALAAEPLIELAFGRGAFDGKDVLRTTAVFRSMLPGFCAMLVSVVLTRAIYCLSDVERFMAAVGVGWSLVYFCACGMLLPLGGPGFGASYSAAWLAYASVAGWILHRRARPRV